MATNWRNSEFRIPEHRPHGTLAQCPEYSDPFRVVIGQDSRWNKDIRVPKPKARFATAPLVPRGERARTYYYKARGDRSLSATGYKDPNKISAAEQMAIRRCSQSLVVRLERENTPPFRLGGCLGGSGAPGAKAERWAGQVGQPGWSLIQDNFNIAPAVRDRLHVKNEFGYQPPPEPPFKRYNRPIS